MKISREDMLELRALDAELIGAKSAMDLAQRAFNEAQNNGKQAQIAYRALHERLGIDAEKHSVLTRDAKQDNGVVIEAGTVVNRVDNTLYVPDAKPAPIPINRAQRRLAKK